MRKVYKPLRRPQLILDPFSTTIPRIQKTLPSSAKPYHHYQSSIAIYQSSPQKWIPYFQPIAFRHIRSPDHIQNPRRSQLRSYAKMPQLFHPDPSSVTVTREVTENITTFSVPFARFGLAKFGGRATLTKLTSGGLVVFSPVTLTDEVAATVTSLGGQVSYIVAPDMEHHIHLGPWKAAYPTARVIGPAELYDKRKKQGNEDVAFDFPLTASGKKDLSLPADFTADFDLEYFDGHINKEVVLLHKPSRTMIQADLLFNTPSKEQYSKTGEDPTSGFLTKLLMHLWTTTEGKSQQRFIWYAAAKDRPSFNASALKASGWDFDRIIPCHGDVIETGAKSVFQRIFAWNIAAAQAEAKKAK